MTIKKILIILGTVVAIGLIIFFLAFNKKDTTTYSTEKIIKDSIVETVSETGMIKAQNKIDLSFLGSGRIAKINYQVGDQINKNNVLAELDYESLNIRKDEANASIAVSRANLNKLIAGATEEDIAVVEASLKQAKTSYEASVKEYDKNIASLQESLEQAQKTLDDLLDNNAGTITTYEQSIVSSQSSLENTELTYQKSIDNYKENYLSTLDDKLAVCNSALNLIDTIINDDDLENKLSIKNISYLENTKKAYNEGINLLAIANSKLNDAKINNSNENAVLAINSALNALNKTFESLTECYSALENTITSSSLTSAELEAFKTSIASQQILMATAISSAQAVKQSIEGAILNYDTNVLNAENALMQSIASYDAAVLSARNVLSSAEFNNSKQTTALQSRVDNAFEAWQLAQSQLNKIKAPANKHDISLAQAQLRQSEASLDSILKQINDSIIKSPIEGIITEIFYEVGEQAVTGQTVVSLLLENNFKIEVLVSEADIAKLNLLNSAEISLDAFSDDIIFNGVVNFIEPAETVIQDVVYYKVIVYFIKTEEQLNAGYFDKIKPGMTANVIITTDKRDGVLVMPFRAIIDRNGSGKFTRVFKNNLIEERKIDVGLKGDGGLVEVLSGLKEGEEVVTYVSEGK
jgi:RND family efflux transporter MFP subunit